MISKINKYDFCIIGGGFQGLVLAYNLSKNHKVAVIEKDNVLGGVLSGIKVGDCYVERYYHHVFPQNDEIIELIAELGLQQKLVWKEVSNGFYYDKKIYGLSNPTDLLFFKPLSFVEKLQFCLFILKLKGADPEKLDSVKAKDWIISNSSYNLYKKMFEPLIINKFGEENLEKVSAGWFVGRVKIRSNSKRTGELLGYLEGGFQQFIETLATKIKENGSEIIQDEFTKLNIRNNSVESLTCHRETIDADKFISTINPKILFKNIELSGDYKKKLDELEYHGTICVLLGLKKKISETYWINIINEKTPFRAIIEHTNLQSPERYHTHLIYLASYHAYDSKIWETPPKKILNESIAGLKHLFPSIKDEDIDMKEIFIDKDAGMISKQNFFKNLLPLETPFKNLYAIGMFNAYPERGLNIQLKHGKKLLSILKKEFQD